LDLVDEPVPPLAIKTKTKKRKNQEIIEIDSSDDGISNNAGHAKRKQSKNKQRQQPAGIGSDDDVVVVDQKFVTPTRRLKRPRLDLNFTFDSSSPPLPSLSHSTSSAPSTSRLPSPSSPDDLPFALLASP
jgi:hypothetical protein